ncbi:hypothetical protein [Noviherbaspirillum sp. Root189]|uniref:hypothetical protein n=1 Tax=Noviherbaspirillum sp. Root189 TaxID=1736487 RepID=UPI0007148E83|nr:hypothetical protein [Noviherbaspirillum sp. Root189]KRB93810.1 hypothetical protein ASE07_12140 [Noviherbaspirillum sp. Root189]
MRLKIDYRLTGTGWAECELSDEEASCVVTASYLSDALRNLVLAATAVISGFNRVAFGFDEEPGEYRWVITTSRINEIDLQILEFNELWSGKLDDEGRLLFHTRCLPDTFADAVHVAAQKILNELSAQGYEDKWSEHPFPMAQLQELGRLLEEQKRDA